MGGINAILNLNKQPVAAEMLHGMNLHMIHRGPDRGGVWVGHRVGLGFRHLAVNDLRKTKRLLSNEDGRIWIVCDGKIDNDPSLRKKLLMNGHQFCSESSSETILHLYEEYGSDCVHHLRGAFAFVIWDEREDRLFAARDHFGIKPLYFTYDGETLLCSSELKSLLHTGRCARNLDRQSLLFYLTYQYVPAPRTMVEGVSKLPAAHRLIVQGGQIRVERYWRPEFEPATQPVEERCQTIRTTLQNAVKQQMLNGRSVGCFLSSGIDSTAIAALMRQEGPLKTFSVGFQGKHNECLIAKETAKVLGTDHRERIIEEQDYFNAVEECIWFQDEPVADPSAVALYLLSQLASQHVKVVLSGEGADECFGGYRLYQEPLALSALQWMPQSLKDTLHRSVRPLPHFYGKNYILRATTPLEKRFIGNAKIFTDDIANLITEQHKYDGMLNAYEWARQYYDRVQHNDDITRMQYIDLNLWLPDNILTKADKMALAHSLDLRLPFLDFNVFDVARKIPAACRVDKTMTKRLLREALQEIVPRHVLRRPKLGFPVPLRQWLTGKRGDECLAVIRSSGLRQYLNLNEVEQLIRQHQDGKANHARKIWVIYVLAQWYTLFLEGHPSAFASLNTIY